MALKGETESTSGGLAGPVRLAVGWVLRGWIWSR